MPHVTIVQVSDLHLSRTHPFFVANWRAVAQRLDRTATDLVIASGDLTVDGAASDDDLAFAVDELSRVDASPLATLPGNHDVGEEVLTTSHDQRIDEPRRQRWLDAFGPDWWVREVGNWRLVGLNSQLLGSGLAAEGAQWSWLEDLMCEPPVQPTAIFLHKPLFLESQDETDRPGEAILRAPRQRLLKLMTGAEVRFVACGHVHQYRSRHVDGIEYVWAPSTAFLVDHLLSGSKPVLGFVEFRLDEGGGHLHTLGTVPEIMSIELSSLKAPGGYRRLRDIPPAAVDQLMREYAIPAVSSGLPR